MIKVFTIDDIKKEIPETKESFSKSSTNMESGEILLNLVDVWAKNKNLVFMSYTLSPPMFIFREEEEQWEVESVDKYWYFSSRNGVDYIEITFWVNPKNNQRKETKREVKSHYGDKYSLPDWARSITDHRKSLDNNVF